MATAAAQKPLRHSANLHFAVLDDLARLAEPHCINKPIRSRRIENPSDFNAGIDDFGQGFLIQSPRDRRP
jgi:hypothetical protein